jgi:hypothetical protein
LLSNKQQTTAVASSSQEPSRPESDEESDVAEEGDIPPKSGVREVSGATDDEETEDVDGSQSSDNESTYNPKGKIDKGKGKETQGKKRTQERMESSGEEIEAPTKPRNEKKKAPHRDSVAPRRLMKAPDLPLPTLPTMLKKKKSLAENTPKVAGFEAKRLSQETVDVTLFCADRDKQPIQFEFKVPDSTVR